MSTAPLGIRGHLIDAPEPAKLRGRSNSALIVEEGLITEIGDYEMLRKKPRAEPVRWTHSEQVAVFPGLIDIHTHLPQYPAVARGESALLPWLQRHIFPLEREFVGARAKREAALFFADAARHGTTTPTVFTAVFHDSCDAAFEAASEAGLRVIMGKMMMDVGSYGTAPPEKVVATSLHESEALFKKWDGANQGLLEYAFSPRFAVSCSEEMMRGAAALARERNAFIQTHLSENLGEIEAVRQQFPWARDYTDVYEQCGLLTEKTLLGHCIHLSPRELNAIASAGARVAHCPTSNLFLGSGIMPLDRIRAASIRVGLGSDVAAGPELNMWHVMRATIESQKARSFFEENVAVPTPAEALHLATQSAADALHKGGIIGSLDIGKEADLVVVDVAALLPYGRKSKAQADLAAEDILSLCIFRGGPHTTLETIVRGRSVYKAAEGDLF